MEEMEKYYRQDLSFWAQSRLYVNCNHPNLSSRSILTLLRLWGDDKTITKIVHAWSWWRLWLFLKREEGDRKRTTFVAVDDEHKFLGDLFHIYLKNIIIHRVQSHILWGLICGREGPMGVPLTVFGHWDMICHRDGPMGCGCRQASSSYRRQGGGWWDQRWWWWCYQRSNE